MKKKEKGSFTVEAALIMPVILGITVLFIYAAMYARDRCILEYAALSGAMNAVSGNEETEELAEEYAGKVLSEELLGKWDTNISVYSDEYSTEVCIEATDPFFDRVREHRARAFKHFCPKY